MEGLQMPKEMVGLVDKLQEQAFEAQNSHATDGDLSPEEKAALAEKEAAEKLKKEKENQQNSTNNNQTDDENQESDEEIQAKLDELAKKEEKDLTDEEKQYIEKYTAPPDEISSVKNTLQARFGLEFEGTFENNETGLTSLVEEAAPKLAQQMLANYFESVPYMSDFYKHVVVEKKSLETFLAKNEKPAFQNIEIKDTTDVTDDKVKEQLISNQKAIFKMDLAAKGVSEEDINGLIDLAEASGKLFEKAKAAQANLVNNHKAQVEAKLKEEETRIKADQLAVQQEFTKAVEMVTKNNFDGISIPETDVKAFKDSLTRLDAKGYSVLDYKREKLTLAQRLLLDYIVFKDVKIPGLNIKAQQQSKTFSFRKASEDNNVRNGGRVRGSGGSDNKGNTSNNLIELKNVDFGNLVKR